jgi:excisionase family DNA binding protein
MEVDSTARIESSEPQQANPHSNRPMTPQQVAAFLGLDDKTVTRWARKRYLPAHPMGEGKKKYWRFFEHELLTWLLAQSETAVAA